MYEAFEGIVPPGSGEEGALRAIDPARLPRHIAIIMDGNGRWAGQRAVPRVSGHRAGAESVREAVETCARLGVPYLTLYAFSTENWKRPRLEVQTLMRLLREFLARELQTLLANDIRFRAMGRIEVLAPKVRREIAVAEERTAHCRRLLLTVALNYSGRAELVDAVRRLLVEVHAAGSAPADLVEGDIARNLYCPDLPDPDLLIRTSGELRVSNFMLWQIAYSEIHVTPTLWPDFRRKHLFEAIVEYQRRERRFGGLTEAGRNEQPRLTGVGAQADR
jgi:undecaprenyl diphosphate synthase